MTVTFTTRTGKTWSYEEVDVISRRSAHTYMIHQRGVTTVVVDVAKMEASCVTS